MVVNAKMKPLYVSVLALVLASCSIEQRAAQQRFAVVVPAEQQMRFLKHLKEDGTRRRYSVSDGETFKDGRKVVLVDFVTPGGCMFVSADNFTDETNWQFNIYACPHLDALAERKYLQQLTESWMEEPQQNGSG